MSKTIHETKEPSGSNADKDKWVQLDSDSKAFRAALGDFSTAIEQLCWEVDLNDEKRNKATGDIFLLSKIKDINELRELDIRELVNRFTDLPSTTLPSMMAFLLEKAAPTFAKYPDKVVPKAQAYVAAAKNLFNKAAEFNEKMQQLNKNDKTASQQKENHHQIFADLKTKLQQASKALQTKNASGNTPVGTFAKACARFGAALVALPLMLAGVVVSAVGYVVSPGTYAAGIIIGASAALVMKDPNPIVDLVGSSVIMLGELMSIAGRVAGKYSLSGDNADFAEERKALGIDDDWVGRRQP